MTDAMTEDAIFAHAAVAAPHSLAAEAGRDILISGGNAIEAMVAMAASIAVVYPHMNSIGGDGFWLIREPRGKIRAIEACGFAGEKATIAAYEATGGIPTRGPKAALTVPGAIGGWRIALELAEALGGRLPLADLVERACAQAREGVAVSPSEGRSQPRDGLLYDAPNFRATYFVDDEPPKAGARRKQQKLGETLAQLADAGLDDFYRGDIARELAADLDALGSPVTRADLKAYQARWREPLSIKADAATLYNTPVPTQGFASLMLLGIYERLRVKSPDSVESAHALIEATKRAFAHRDRCCIDFEIATADFEQLLSPVSLQAEASRISTSRAARWPLPAEQGDTIWMGAIDKDGLAVSYIQSVYWEYGSGVALPRTGVLMQNRGIAFSLDPASPRALKPGRRPFHTLNPAMAVFPDGRVMPYGSMGGDGQPQFQAQVFCRIAAGRSLLDAVSAPRLLWGRAWGAESATVKLEAAYDDAIGAALQRIGHEVERMAPGRQDLFGHAGALRRGLKGEVAAAHDPRSDGGAAGI
jgi:gamma-glutamyltranspeptidase/glutathione hydrolase